MTNVDAAVDLLVDGFSRVREDVADLTEDLPDEMAQYRPDADANPIAWLLWHLARMQDQQVSELAGREQVWTRWRDRFDLPFGAQATGYGQNSEEVGRVRVGADLLAGYHAEVHEATLEYLRSLTADELERIVDERFDPPVTAAARLVSVFDDAAKHLGQAAYVRGLAERHGSR